MPACMLCCKLQIVCVQENDKNKALFVTNFEHHYCKTTSDGYKYCLQTLFIILQSHKKCKCSAQECFENYCLIITITIYQNLYKELYIIIMELSTMQYDWMDGYFLPSNIKYGNFIPDKCIVHQINILKLKTLLLVSY